MKTNVNTGSMTAGQTEGTRGAAGRPVVIVGGGYAGLMAAARLASRCTEDVVLVEPSSELGDRIWLHRQAVEGRKPLPIRSLLPSRVKHLQGRVLALQPEASRVVVKTAEGESTLEYSQLILSVGSRTARQIPGDASQVDLLEPETIGVTIEGISRLKSGASVVVVGGGTAGIELVCELAERRPALAVTLIERGRLGTGFSPEGRNHLLRTFQKLGISLLEETSVERVEKGALQLSDGRRIPFARCVWTAGLEPSPLIRESGLPLADAGRLRVNAQLQVEGYSNIWAAGDGAAVPGAGGATVRMACASALPSGAHLGENVARALRGEPLEPFRFGFLAQCLSLGRGEGLVQPVDASDVPVGQIRIGWQARLTKWFIGWMVINSIRLEARSGLRLYRWRQPTLAGFKQLPAGGLS